jgi:AcrR family transcriptional regulator
LEQGFVVLREGGEAALTIDRLCKDLGRTKGAFYHHFADVTVYTDALLAAWEERNSAGAAVSRAVPAGLRRGRRAAAPPAVAAQQQVRALDVPLDRSFRAWGLRDARARQFVARIDDRRIASLASTYPTAIPLAMRRKLARLEYAVFVGVQQLYPDLSSAAVRELERMLQAALHAVAGGGKRGSSAARLPTGTSRSRAS